VIRTVIAAVMRSELFASTHVHASSGSYAKCSATACALSTLLLAQVPCDVIGAQMAVMLTVLPGGGGEAPLPPRRIPGTQFLFEAESTLEDNSAGRIKNRTVYLNY
jgi:hypothetical protein